MNYKQTKALWAKRRAEIVKLSKTLDRAKLAKQFGVTKQRISKILKDYA